jgi:hypothetical protein
VLSSIDGDEVNSVNNTTESRQVAMIVRRVYLDLLANISYPEKYGLGQLTSSGSALLPVVMYRPNTFNTIQWIKYNKADLTFVEPSVFFDYIYTLDDDEDNVGTATINSVAILYNNDVDPRFWTTLDDSTILFDSYNATDGTTLLTANSVIYGEKVATFDINDDTFTPVLDDNQFSLLVNEAKSLAYAELKQTAHQKAEQTARRQRVKAQNNKRAVAGSEYINTVPNYGRK